MPERDYLSRITEIISTIRATQKESIDKAAEAFARSIVSGGRVYLFGSGHSVIPVLDIFPRYGSFVGFYPIYDPRLMWFNVVDWATAEPKPGEFHFENLDLLTMLAQQRSLRVIVQIYTDSAPDWVGQRYPDGRFVDRSGAVINSQAAPGYCIDHAGVRAELVRFIEALSREANESPALYGWDVWSEPHVINWADLPYLVNPEFCFCPHTQARFREWLTAKYKTLNALNTAWYRGFETWDEVQPPRFPTILSYADYLDWRAFIDDKLAGDLKTRVDAVRTADRTHPITSHAAAPALFTSPMDGYGEPDDWKMASNADFFGTSLYPMHSESAKPWSYPMLAAALDFERSPGISSGKAFWIGELQAGQGTTGMRIPEPVTARDVECWMWQAVAHGAKEIAVYAWYPMSSGFESNGYGLIQSRWNFDGPRSQRRPSGANYQPKCFRSPRRQAGRGAGGHLLRPPFIYGRRHGGVAFKARQCGARLPDGPAPRLS